MSRAFKNNTAVSEDWLLYEKGKEYNQIIGLYEAVNKNERFYRGDQWNGVNSGGLPTPVFNVFKRIIGYLVSTLTSQKTSFKISADSTGAIYKKEIKSDLDSALSLITSYLNYRYEKDGLDKIISDGVYDAALTGDMFLYVWWDSEKNAGEAYRGDFCTTLIDNTNVFFGNVNSAEVQSQPYILISGRELVDKLTDEARRNGAKQEDYEKILPDNDCDGQAGDRGKNELRDTKCSYIIKLYKENGTVKYRKSTKSCTICDNIDTGLSLYPLAMMNWDRVKNSYHGGAAATGLIENQVYINKAFAMVMKHMINVSFSKVVYNANLIDEWTNTVGEAIAVNGSVENVASTIEPGAMQSGFLDVINMTMGMTKELMGATDAALGNVRPDNTSAIIALQQASSIPLESQKKALYAALENLGMIWLDFILHYYNRDRLLIYRKKGELYGGSFNTEKFKDAIFSCNLDVGMSTYWSEIATVNTLDNLLKSGHITFDQYLERLPDGYLPLKEDIIHDYKMNRALAAQNAGKEQGDEGKRNI